jgi:hypothetical protein
MVMNIYQAQLDWAVSNGAEINKKISRQAPDGIFGFYANESINSGETLVKVPKSLAINHKAYDFPTNTSLTVRQVYASAKLLSDAANERESICLLMLEPLDILEKLSTYFASEKELKIIAELSQTLANEIKKQNNETDSILGALLDFDSTVDKDLYLRCILNFKSRAIGKIGFVPIIEGFNHSSEYGDFFDSRNDYITAVAKKSCRPGEQVFISYGRLDMMTHAVNYNYFDPADSHFLNLSKRVEFIITNPRERAMAEKLQRNYKLTITRDAALLKYRINEPNIFFTEQGPSEELINLAIHMTSHNGEKCEESARKYLLSLIQKMQKSNHVQDFSARYLPRRFKRFYHMLVKEQKLLGKLTNQISAKGPIFALASNTQ